MPAWLKTLGGALLAAGLGFLAFTAAKSAAGSRGQVKKWQDRAIELEESDVEEDVALAEAAHEQAELHGKAAEKSEQRTKDAITKSHQNNETMADITSAWRKPRRDPAAADGMRERSAD